MEVEKIFQDDIIVSNEYKYLAIFKDGKFHQGAKVNYAVMQNNLFEYRLFASLEGHKILDTGIIPKTDKLTYHIKELE